MCAERKGKRWEEKSARSKENKENERVEGRQRTEHNRTHDPKGKTLGKRREDDQNGENVRTN